MRPLAHIAAAGMLLAVGVPDCGPGESQTAPASSIAGPSSVDGQPGLSVSQARWTLAWDKRGVTPAPGGGWTVDTDLGYRVHLRAGRLVVHSLALGQCERPAMEEASFMGLLLGPSLAWAHEDSDVSAIELGVEEDLADPVELGPLWSGFPAARYCRAHWMVARADGLGGDPFLRTSIHVEGTWERGGRGGEFAVTTWWPEGQLADLGATAAMTAADTSAAAAGPLRAVVTVERRLSSLFSGVDFETATEAQLVGRALQNVVGSAAVRIALEPAPVDP